MNKLTWIVLVAPMIAGCRDKQPSKQAAPAPASAQGSAWLEQLPSVAAGETQVLLQYTSGLVRINADGSIHTAAAPTTAATDPRNPGGDPFTSAKPVQLGALATTLGLPPITPRSENAITVVASPRDGDAGAENPTDVAFARLAHPVPASGAPAVPTRATTAFALAHPHDVSGGVVVFADAKAPAAVLVDVLAQTGGFLAIRHGSQLSALPISVDRHAPASVAPTQNWVEVRLGPTIEIESVPSKATQVAAVDNLADAVKAAGANAVDLLVGPDSKVQDLVTAVDQLRAANIDAIGFGRAPAAGSPEAAARGEQGPRVIAWDFYLQEVDKANTPAFRSVVDGTLEPIRKCYGDALAKKPDLGGTAQLELFVAPSGKVATADAAGVPAPVVTCIVTALRTAKFPIPGSAGAKITAQLSFVPR